MIKNALFSCVHNLHQKIHVEPHIYYFFLSVCNNLVNLNRNKTVQCLHSYPQRYQMAAHPPQFYSSSETHGQSHFSQLRKRTSVSCQSKMNYIISLFNLIFFLLNTVIFLYVKIRYLVKHGFLRHHIALKISLVFYIKLLRFLDTRILFDGSIKNVFLKLISQNRDQYRLSIIQFVYLLSEIGTVYFRA